MFFKYVIPFMQFCMRTSKEMVVNKSHLINIFQRNIHKQDFLN